MILTNARLIFPDGIRDGLEVVVHDGKIDAIRPAARARGKDVVMCTARSAVTLWRPR